VENSPGSQHSISSAANFGESGTNSSHANKGNSRNLDLNSNVISTVTSVSESRNGALTSLSFLLACNVVYMYFLDWNILTLSIRAFQLFCVYKGRRNDLFLRKLIFYVIVVFANLPVLMVHLFYKGIQPLILVFVGDIISAAPHTVLVNDALIIALESLIILHAHLLRTDG